MITSLLIFECSTATVLFSDGQTIATSEIVTNCCANCEVNFTQHRTTSWSNGRNIDSQQCWTMLRQNVASLLRQNFTEVKFYNIFHSYLRGGQTDATLTPNNVGLCGDRMLRPFDPTSYPGPFVKSVSV